jgi:serine-type D-Ala-D-Ala carboxypeptidase/endopeptidase (penicillin-binding protein 4)
MKNVFGIIGLLFSVAICSAQTISQRLETAWQKFAADSQVKHATASLYVIDARSGEVVFDQHSQIGMAPASTQKIITTVTAFEILGKDFRYSTQLGLEKRDGKTILHVYGQWDPTFGSWRWESTSDGAVLKRWVSAIRQAGIKKVDHVIFENNGETETIPDGWIWQDIGNYYGAGANIFNWRENQFDIILKSGATIGDRVSVVRTVPKVYDVQIESFLKSAGKNTGDNAYLYYPFDNKSAVLRGTIPINENNFKISAALPSGFNQFLKTLSDTLGSIGIKIPAEETKSVISTSDVRDIDIIQNDYSPSLDSIIYWFNKKSINLYGEALVKTMGAKFTGAGATDSGVNVIKRFWKEKGIDVDELNIYDGSGLSPLNRVTTHAQVEILKFAKNRDWFPYFYNALPEYNGMHMKSGTISDVKGFCGYHTASDGKEYIFSILVNNYGGRTNSMVGKMYKLLDELK